MNNIVLILRSGGDFTLKDVELLSYHLHKKGNVSIYCLYDRVSIPINLKQFTLLPMPEPHYKGWWAKMHLFNPILQHLRPFIFMDLDTAVINSGINELLQTEKTSSFITLTDFYKDRKLASGVMLIPNDNSKVADVWNEWGKNSAELIKKFRGDQDVIGAIVQADYFWQDLTNSISSFKPNKKWLTTLPTEKSVICFHGKPRIWEAAKTVKWVKEYINEFATT